MNPIDRVLSIIAPETCVGCSNESSVLCADCQGAIDTLPSICYACGKATRANMPCTNCIKRSYPDHVWLHASYKGIAKDVLQAYKFKEKRSAAKPIAECLDSSLPYFANKPLVTFVPTATSHNRQRGFDHAELLVKELCRIRHWNYTRLLHRSSQIHQIGAGWQQRKQQLKGMFAITNPKIVQGQHILLVDDVVTTGATIEECSKILKAAGAQRVDVIAFARTP